MWQPAGRARDPRGQGAVPRTGARECWAKQGGPPRPCPQLNPRLGASRAGREYVFVDLSRPICGISLRSPQDIHTHSWLEARWLA